LSISAFAISASGHLRDSAFRDAVDKDPLPANPVVRYLASRRRLDEREE
jgi:hypothetical protein